MLAGFGAIAAQGPRGARQVWLDLGRWMAVALLLAAVWLAGMFATALVAQRIWNVDPLRPMLVYGGSSYAAAALSRADWFWKTSGTESLVARLGQRTTRLVFVGAGLAAAVYGMIGLIPAGSTADHPVAAATGEQVSCRRCSLSFRLLGTFPRGDDDTLFGFKTQLMVLASGAAIVAPVMPSGGIARFDTSGRLVRVAGRSGGGPGELGDVFSLAPSADSLLVAARDRISLFADDLAPIREAPVATVYWVVRALGGGAFAASSVSPHGGPTLHVLGPDLALHRSFGTLPVDAPGERRPLAVGARAQFWAAVPGRYRLEQWDSSGVLLKSMDRPASFFPAWTQRDEFGRNLYTDPPLPRVVDLYASGSELWVLLEVVDAHWKPAPAPPGEAHPMLSLAAVERRVDRLLEVLDTATGSAVVSVRLPMFAISFGAGGQLVSVREDSSGIRRFDEWAVRVQH